MASFSSHIRGFSQIKAKLLAGIGTTLISSSFASLNSAIIHASFLYPIKGSDSIKL